jgi:hypothetical protein
MEIANTRISDSENLQLPMVTLQALRIEYGIEAGILANDTRLKDYNSLPDFYVLDPARP